jgi:putative transposase
LRGAWAKNSAQEALKELRATVKWLETINPSAARSLEEGLEETLTLTQLNLHKLLVRTFSTTNLIESCFARTNCWTRRVKRWRGATMVLRWGAAALLFAEKGFRHVRGYNQMHELVLALQKHQSELAPMMRAA